MAFFTTVLGVVLVLEGMPWFLNPPGYKSLLRQILSMSDLHLRLGGLAAMLVGLLLVRLAVG